MHSKYRKASVYQEPNSLGLFGTCKSETGTYSCYQAGDALNHSVQGWATETL